MRQAPAVQVRCSGQPVLRRIESSLWATSAGVLVLWAMLWLGGSTVMAGGVALAVALIVAVVATQRPPRSSDKLMWTGQAWCLASTSRAEPVAVDAVQVMLDGGSFMLLRLSGASIATDRRWVWVAATPGTDFRALCTALYAQRSTPSPSPTDPHP